MLIDLVLLAVSLVVLTGGAELLVRGAVTIARRLGVSSFFIGLTIIGFGTSTPELCTSVVAALRGAGDIAVGNVVGSNIFNIAVILGVTALVSPIPLRLGLIRREVAAVIGVAFVPLLAALAGGVLPRWMGLLMLAGLVVFLGTGYAAGRREGEREAGVSTTRELEAGHGVGRVKLLSGPLGSAGLVLTGLLMLVGGSMLLVSAASSIARGLGVSDLVIALTIVSAGTSAPELVTSLVAAVRRQSDICVGNILGSNIFNILGILGITCVVMPQDVTRQTLLLDVPVMIAVSLACIPVMRSGARISRGEGVALLVMYAAYVLVLFAWAPGWFATA